MVGLVCRVERPAGGCSRVVDALGFQGLTGLGRGQDSSVAVEGLGLSLGEQPGF